MTGKGDPVACCMTIRDILQDAAASLRDAGFISPRLDAEILLAHSLGKERLFFFTNPDHVLTNDDILRFRRLLVRRLGREPVAYIVGSKPFWSLVLDVDRRVLIPRPETEILVEEVLKIASRSDNVSTGIVDVGTGSGAISLAFASELQQVRLTATDISPEAIQAARANARKVGLDHRIAFVVGDMVRCFAGPFDMLVSNPPYIPAGDYDALPEGVRRFEPRIALWGGPEGLSFYEELIGEGGRVLRKGGWLCLEMGAGQRARIEDLLNMSGLYGELRFRTDYAGIDRVVVARRR